jgi:enediyne biosynthesis protein E4
MTERVSSLKTPRSIAWLALSLGLACQACSPPPSQSAKSANPQTGSPAIATPKTSIKLDLRDPLASSAHNPAPDGLRFREATDSTGISFVQMSGDDENKYFPTANGSGVAMFDFDLDGRKDLYFATTRNLPLDAPTKSGGNRLYRSLGNGKFEDVTELAGVGYNGFTHGVSTGDVNGDGFTDLFITNLGPNVLYINNGDGTFRDGTAGLPSEHPPWSSGSAFFDFDNDGDLDLYVSCYGVWSIETNERCGDLTKGVRTYCTPLRITPAVDYLYRNEGDGTFQEVTSAAGIVRDDGRGMGVLAMDFNLDGLIDIFVANDLSPNYLFLNKGDGTFDDISEISGASASESGANQAGMGVDADDLDGDGLPEIFVTHFQNDYDTLYKNLDGQNFQDVTSASGTSKFRDDVGWACSLADFDLDSKPDMMVFNGHVDNNLDQLGTPDPQAEVAHLWKGMGGVKFALASSPGPYFSEPHVCRGASFGDLNDDGGIDVVTNRMDSRPAVLINESERGAWVGFDLIGRESNRDAIGAVLVVHSGDKILHRQVKGGGSYHSANDRRVVVGLGDAKSVDRVEIRWPKGAKTELNGPALGRYHTIVETANEQPSQASSSASSSAEHRNGE